MEKSEMIQTALSEGFLRAAVIPASALVFDFSYRRFCEENVCGNYGANYCCPPDCGTPQEMQERALSYENALVVQSKAPVQDTTDSEEAEAIKNTHMEHMLALVRRYEALGIYGEPIMAGGCHFCKVCKKIEGKPCVRPEGQHACLSAYCIDVNCLAETCGMELDWEGKEISYLTLYLYHEDQE